MPMTDAQTAAAGDLLGPLLFGTPASSSSSSTSVSPFQSTTGLGTANFTSGGDITTSLDPRFLGLQNQFLGGAGSALGQLGAFQTNPFQASQPFDLEGVTQDQFDLLERIQGRGREQQAQNLEERLFSQGRLGSTGGINEQRNLQDFFGQQQAQNLASAFGQGLAGQQQQFGQDLATSQQQNAQQQLLSSLGSGLFSSALTPEQMLLNQLQVGGNLSTVSSAEQSSGNEGGLLSSIGF